MGSKSSNAPPPDPRLIDAQLKSMGLQDGMIQKFMDYQSQLTPIQMQEITKGIQRADDQYAFDTARTTRLDEQDANQFAFTMDYNKAALASQAAGVSGANAAAMANAQANGAAVAVNGRLADSAIKLNDYQQAQMKERDQRWRMVGMPQEDKLIAKVNEMGSDKYKNQQMGMAVADVNQSASDVRGQTVREMARRGMDGGGQFASMMSRGNADHALALAGTKNNTRTALTNMDMANQFQLNGVMKGMAGAGDMSAGLAIGAIGAGKMNGGGGGGGGGGGFSPMGFGGGGGGHGGGPNVGAGVNIANAGSSGVLGGYQMGSGMAGGLGSNASSMYSSMGSYKNGQDQIAASNNPWNTMLGAAAGAGTSYLMKGSDRRLKTDIVAVGRLDNGLTVYRYRYTAGGPFELGVMADEVATHTPAAFVAGGAGDGFDAVMYDKL